jgi:hypothetical protein
MRSARRDEPFKCAEDAMNDQAIGKLRKLMLLEFDAAFADSDAEMARRHVGRMRALLDIVEKFLKEEAIEVGLDAFCDEWGIER